MALFGLSLKKIKEGIDLGTSLFNVGKSSLENIFGQPQVSAPPPTPQLPVPSVTPPQQQPFNFASTFKQPGAPAQQSFPQPLSLSTFSTKLPTAPSTVLETVKQVAPTVPESAKPINPFDIVKGFSKAASIAIPATPFGETTQGKIASQGFGELGKGNIPGAAKSLFQTGLETGVQVSPMGQAAKISAPIQAAITKTTPQIEYEKNLDFGRSIVNVGPNMASTIPGSLAGIATGGKAIQEPINKVLYGNEKAQQIKQQQEQIVKDLYKVGENIKNIGVPKYDQTSIQSQLGDAVGSIGQSLLIMSTGPAAVPLFYQQAQGRASLDTYRNTGDINKSAIAGATYGLVEAALEKFSLGLILKPAVTSSVKNVVFNLIKKLAVEGSTEGAQQLAENVIRMLAGDKSIKTWWQNVPESAIFGAIAGGAVAGPVEIANFNFVNKQLKNIQEQSSRLPVSYDYTKLSEALNNKIQFDAQNIQNQLLQINPETQVGPRPATQQERQIEQQQRQIEQQNIAQQQAAPTATSDLLQGYQLPSQRTQTDLQGQIQDITTQFPKISPEAANRLIQQYDYPTVIGVASEIQKSGTAKNLEAVLTSELQKRFGKSNVQVAPVQSQEALFAEARKYKSADEFVKAQKPIYHGTPEKLTLKELNANKTGKNTISKKGFYEKAKGIYFTDNLSEAKQYSTYKRDIKGLKVKNPTIIKGYVDESNIKEIKTNDILMESDVANIRKQGYSGIKKIGVGKTAGNTEWIIFDKNILKDKSELTDIWNKANQPTQTTQTTQKPEPSLTGRDIRQETQSTNSDFGQIETDVTVKHELQKALDSIKSDVGQLISDIDNQPFTFEEMAQDIQRASRDPKFKPSKEVLSYYGKIKNWLDSWADYAGLPEIKTKEFYLPQFSEDYIYDYNNVANDAVFTLDSMDFGFSKKRQDKLNLSTLDYSPDGLVRYAIQAKAYALRHDIRAEQIMLEQERELETENAFRKQNDMPPVKPLTKDEAIKAAQTEEDLVKSIQGISNTSDLQKELKKSKTIEGVTKPANVDTDNGVEQSNPSILDKFSDLGRQEGKLVVEDNNSLTYAGEKLSDSFDIYTNKSHTNYFTGTKGTMWDTMGFDVYQNAPAAAVNIRKTANVNALMQSKTRQELFYDFAEFYYNKISNPEAHTNELNNPNTENTAYKIYRQIADSSARYNTSVLLHPEATSKVLNETADYLVFRLAKRVAPINFSDEFVVGTWDDFKKREGFKADQQATATKVAEMSKLVPNEVIDQEEIDGVITRIQDIVLKKQQINLAQKVLVNELTRTKFTDKALRQVLARDVVRILREDNINRSFVNKLSDGVTNVVHTAALGLNVSSAMYNTLETKQIYALFGGKVYRNALSKASRPGGLEIVSKYGVDTTKGYNIEDYVPFNEQIEGKPKTSKLSKANDVLMYMFNKSEQWKDAVMLHAFEQKGIEMGLTGSDLTNYVMSNFNRYGIKYGQFGTLGFNKTKTGKIALQFMQYTVKNAKIFGKQAYIGYGGGEFTGAERKLARAYTRRIGLFNVLTWLILGRLMGAGWEQIFGIFNPLSKRAKSDNAVIQTLMYIPMGPIGASLLNFADAVVAENIASEDQQRAFEWSKTLTPTIQSNLALIFPAGVQLFNKAGIQAYIPGMRDWMQQGAIRDIERGYNVSATGKARFLAPDNAFEIAKALIFGPYVTDKAKEYFGQTPVFGLLPGDIRNIPVFKNIDGKGRKYVPISDKMQEEINSGKYTPAEAIARGREQDAMIKNAFYPQPGDTPSRIKEKETLKRNYDAINRTVFNVSTGKRESDVLSREKWNIVNSDTSLELFNFLKQRTRLYEKDYGYAVDPIFELTDPKQIRQVLQIRSNYTGDEIEQEQILRATQQWYRDYEKKYADYGKQIAANKIEPGDEFGFSQRKQAYLNLKPPTNTALMDQYYAIKNKDAAAAKEFFKANADQLSADFTNYKQQKLNYINAKRNLEGVPPIDPRVFNNVTFGYEDDERKVFFELYYQKGFKDQFGRRRYTRRFNQPSIYRPSRLPSTTAMRTGMGKQIRLRPGRVVVRRNPM